MMENNVICVFGIERPSEAFFKKKRETKEIDGTGIKSSAETATCSFGAQLSIFQIQACSRSAEGLQNGC